MANEITKEELITRFSAVVNRSTREQRLQEAMAINVLEAVVTASEQVEQQ